MDYIIIYYIVIVRHNIVCRVTVLMPRFVLLSLIQVQSYFLNVKVIHLNLTGLKRPTPELHDVHLSSLFAEPYLV